jgi:hypothetical protein
MGSLHPANLRQRVKMGVAAAQFQIMLEHDCGHLHRHISSSTFLNSFIAASTWGSSIQVPR